MPRVQLTPADVHDALGRVPDPEMPPVSVAELGMVVDVRLDERADGTRVEVDLVPTYSGCPATAVIREDVVAAVGALEGVAGVEVRFVNHVTWTPERITPEGREKLRAFGIAPPGSGLGPALVGLGGVTCPLCSSRNTVADSPFGPTPCRSTHYCRDCRNPFEAVKD